ncbi:TlpA family protein disulfide reductase [Sulfitobacter sp. M57]|uniref:TlpA family protein disulfide reductase n=1 Tax=unclassified Sulfitobacter TaxID=196795 RepID=UPI0023E1E928|nr:MULTISPECIES: TlpA disulfide reductase family protein [unclassified Sulfitobacter]MDF3413226.1 TlpA family protein disulfide reductase [Sulfitobacter sp. KE5]MDF3421491.1 TlpA family protein disulfide reductase [Sulfitobacter sp. KE43]MDF3431775.1 TlpA family protein disulfide reductase [Sulfitobacter sp. KE42]MDF3457415.1 TlpA family protein disulfide reductase [Sulfitobacter sp. S74]MDF3461318.1 TlpA family protein disulfide reductase [Sulfitobacter sp. Ks18]
MITAGLTITLDDLAGERHSFAAGRARLICFVKEDCETCNTAAPVLEALHKAYGHAIDVALVAQSGLQNATFAQRHSLTMPVLDDTACKAAYDWEIESVPSVFWIDENGEKRAQFEGFIRSDWETLAADLSTHTALPAVQIDWSGLPAWRPGCGSKHLDPSVFDRLKAEAENSPIRARRIDVASGDDVAEFMFDQGFSDGLPLVPPTPERVMRMLSGTRRNAQDVVATVAPNMGEATVEKIAINAVMAGCKPEYLPVVIAAVEAICTDEFNIHGVTATTMGAAPVMVVNGPIREKIGMNMKLGALGAGNRANATIGRAVRLVVRNIGGASSGGVERSTLGNPMKFTMCFAEYEERAGWPALHVERGFEPEDSVVTVFAMTGGPVHIVDQTSRGPDQIADSLGLGLEGVFSPKMKNLPVDALLVVCPEHIDTLMREGLYSKDRLRERIQAVTATPAAGIRNDATLALPADGPADTIVSKFASTDFIHIVVAGSEAGKFSSAFHGWVSGETGSLSVSKKIDLG